MVHPPKPSWRARAALLCWLAVATLLACDDHPWARPWASAIAPVRRGLGISQSWAMFAPNPQKATVWLVVQGQKAARWTPLDQAGSTPLKAGARWRYERAGKFTRGLLSPAAKRDRAHLARWWCDQDPELEAVRLLRAQLASDPPGTSYETGPVELTPIGSHRCR